MALVFVIKAINKKDKEEKRRELESEGNSK
jgi:hypothetical protein